MTIFQVVVFALKFCIFVFAAPPLAPSSSLPSLSLFSWETNGSFPSNSSLSSPVNARPHLPQDNYYYRIPFSDNVMKFWDYGSRLPRRSVLGILHDAQRDVAVKIKDGVPMGSQALHYVSASGNVRLLLHVKGGSMTWEVFATVIRALRIWNEQWEFVEFDFNIGQKGLENKYGTGVLVGFDQRVGVDSS